MNILRVWLAAAFLAAYLGAVVPAHFSQEKARFRQGANLCGLHDLDALVGEWKTHHRQLKERVAGSHEWMEFDGTMDFPLMGGFANLDDCGFEASSGAYRGVGLSAWGWRVKR